MLVALTTYINSSYKLVSPTSNILITISNLLILPETPRTLPINSYTAATLRPGRLSSIRGGKGQQTAVHVCPC